MRCSAGMSKAKQQWREGLVGASNHQTNDAGRESLNE
jgi:hypothetical protein